MGVDPSSPWRLRALGDEEPPGVPPEYEGTGLWEFAQVYRAAARANPALTSVVIDAMECWEVAEALGLGPGDDRHTRSSPSDGPLPPVGSAGRRNLAKERYLASKGLMPEPEPDDPTERQQLLLMRLNEASSG